MAAELIIFETARLAAQFFGALYIAWQAVRWALKRYKSERHWERRLAAYSDLVSALGAMNRINGIWEMEEINMRPRTGETNDELKSRYWEARRRIEETSAVAKLLLSPEVAEILKSLQHELERVPGQVDSHFEQLQAEWPLIETANKQITAIGRADLGI